MRGSRTRKRRFAKSAGNGKKPWNGGLLKRRPRNLRALKQSNLELPPGNIDLKSPPGSFNRTFLKSQPPIKQCNEARHFKHRAERLYSKFVLFLLPPLLAPISPSPTLQMAAVMSIYDFFPSSAAAAEEAAVDGVLRSSTPSLVASGSFPLLAQLFVEEAVEAVTEIAVRLSISQTLLRTSQAAAVVPVVVDADIASVAPISAATATSVPVVRPNPRKPVSFAIEVEFAPRSAIGTTIVSGSAIAAPEAPLAADEDYDPYDGLDEDDVWYDDEVEDRFETEIYTERCLVGSHKNERKPVGGSRIPVRATKDNKKEHLRLNKRYNHRYVAKVDRSRAHKLDNTLTRKHGRPTPIYWSPEERRPKTREELDLEEALRRSRREGHIPAAVSVRSLLDLQNRELTPEDYELLLMLDETVEKKKVSKDTFKSFDSATLTADLPVDCPICMSPMSTGEKVTTLPCSHQYHTPCIEQWLTMSSPNCPLDGLSLLHDH